MGYDTSKSFGENFVNEVGTRAGVVAIASAGTTLNNAGFNILGNLATGAGIGLAGGAAAAPIVTAVAPVVGPAVLIIGGGCVLCEAVSSLYEAVTK